MELGDLCESEDQINLVVQDLQIQNELISLVVFRANSDTLNYSNPMEYLLLV